MNVNQQEYNVALQNGRIIHTKINILNFNFQTVGEISGVVLDGSTYNIDATSDIRRTCNITFVPTDSSFDVKQGSLIWLDRYVQVFVGIEDDLNNGEIVYSNLGIYLLNNPEQNYDATNNTIVISGIDLMAKITGMRNGYLEGIEHRIPMNSGIKQSMTSLIRDECGFPLYSIDQPTPTILTPYDLSFPIGSTAYNILSQLRDINANYQTYFDTDGIFWFNQIPMGNDEQVMVTDDVWNKVLISYKKNYDFESVKNVIEVFGKTQDDGNTPYGLAYDDDTNSPFYAGTYNPSTHKFSNSIRIVLSGGEYDNIYPLDKATVYNLVTRPTGNPLNKQYYERSGTSPNYTYTLSTDISVVSGKTYYSRPFDSLAQQRANYELYTRCRLQDQLELTCVPVYWLDVNWLVEITLPNKQSPITQAEKYIIKKIDTTLGVNGTQNITLMKYYPFYPFVVD